jgi:hypothetical protein
MAGWNNGRRGTARIIRVQLPALETQLCLNLRMPLVELVGPTLAKRLPHVEVLSESHDTCASWVSASVMFLKSPQPYGAPVGGGDLLLLFMVCVVPQPYAS